MKVLVLGGGGFIGARICQELLAVGHEVTVFERPRVRWIVDVAGGERVRWLEGDFANPLDVAAAVTGQQQVIHLISTVLPQSSNDNPVYDVETNLIGTLHLLAAARNEGVVRIIFASSGGTVYGAPQIVPIPESHPTEPHCSYGITKLAIEKYLNLYEYLHGVDYRVLRIANPFGEGQNPLGRQGAVAVFTHKALLNEPIEIWGDGSVVRDYIHVTDVALAVLAAMQHQGEERIFNIGSGEGKSLREIVASLECALGRPVSCSYRPARSLDVPSSVLCIDRAARHLAWRPLTDFSTGLARTIAWQRKLEEGRRA